MERELPIIGIKNTDFYVDVSKGELREVKNSTNVISFNRMTDNGHSYTFGYDTEEKNFPQYQDFLYRRSRDREDIGEGQSGAFNDFVAYCEQNEVTIPSMVELDPEGMAIHYNIPVEAVIGKKDFEVVVDQDLYTRRLHGELPTIDIVGHPFYVDIRMGMLRPKDDFLSQGIRFKDMTEINELGDYRALYNPKTHELANIDFNTIHEVPKELIVIQIKNEIYLDPVGFARHHELDVKSFVRDHLPERNLKAGKVNWDDTEIPELVAKNQQRNNEHLKAAQTVRPRKKKGQKL